LKRACKYHIILASKSPRRKELLSQLGYAFEQKSKDVDESFPSGLNVEQIAEYLSKKKANAFKTELEDGELLITSDTTVCLGNQILEKAANPEEAKRMLQMLSGKSHLVITGVCLTSKIKQHSFSVITKVFFENLKESDIDFYIKNYHPFDKAGAYGIQEWIGFIGVDRIEGSYTNVVGLPLKELNQAIETF